MLPAGPVPAPFPAELAGAMGSQEPFWGILRKGTFHSRGPRLWGGGGILGGSGGSSLLSSQVALTCSSGLQVEFRSGKSMLHPSLSLFSCASPCPRHVHLA